MDTFGEFEEMTGSRMAASIGIATGLAMSIALWLAVVDVWLVLR